MNGDKQDNPKNSGEYFIDDFIYPGAKKIKISLNDLNVVYSSTAHALGSAESLLSKIIEGHVHHSEHVAVLKRRISVYSTVLSLCRNALDKDEDIELNLKVFDLKLLIQMLEYELKLTQAFKKLSSFNMENLNKEYSRLKKVYTELSVIYENSIPH